MSTLRLNSANLGASRQLDIKAQNWPGAINLLVRGDGGSGITLSREDAWKLHKWIEENVEPLPEPTVLDRYREFPPGTRWKFHYTNGVEFIKINDELVYRIMRDHDAVEQVKNFTWGGTEQIEVIPRPGEED